jgi:hypothetical protein
MSITSPRRVARLTGLLFLFTILGGIFAQGFVSERLIDFTDAAATASNILVHKGLLQFGFTAYLIEMACQIVTAALWYQLLKPVNKTVALLALLLELAGCIVKTFARVFFIAAPFVLGGTAGSGAAGGMNQGLHGFSPEQLQSIALILLKVNDYGAATALAFFGFSTPLNGYLIFRSSYFPRWLGVLGMIGGVGWLTFLYPPLGYRVFPFIALIGLIGAAAMIFWLLVFGVNEEKWKSQAEAKGVSLT